MEKFNVQEDSKPAHSEAVLPLVIEGVTYDWHKQYISGAEIRKLANIGPDGILILAIKRPWEDEIIEDGTEVDLARPGREHFHVRKHGEGILVSISINDIEHKVKRGKHTVAELKKIGGVPAGYELEELIDKKLTPLDDNASVLIKGCEQFFGHTREGQSS